MPTKCYSLVLFYFLQAVYQHFLPEERWDLASRVECTL